jgi:hypothetical protein
MNGFFPPFLLAILVFTRVLALSHFHYISSGVEFLECNKCGRAQLAGGDN